MKKTPNLIGMGILNKNACLNFIQISVKAGLGTFNHRILRDIASNSTVLGYI